MGFYVVDKVLFFTLPLTLKKGYMISIIYICLRYIIHRAKKLNLNKKKKKKSKNVENKH